MPSKQWEEEDSDSSSAASSPPAGTAAGRRQFDDEEDDSDVLESWDAAEDSEVEREKARKAAETKAKADAEAAANKKSRTERIAERQAARAKAALEDDESEDEDETEAERRERLRRTEKEADLRHAEDLLGDFGNIGISNNRKGKGSATVVSVDGKDPNNMIDLATLPLFNPTTKAQFEQLRSALVPILTSNAKKAHYVMFLQEFAKQLAADLPSDQVKKVSSALTTLSNEKMKAEKASDKGGKKTKAAKTKTSLVASRPSTVDTNTYEEEAFGDDDFM